jgi:hypothetical protein
MGIGEEKIVKRMLRRMLAEMVNCRRKMRIKKKDVERQI